MFALRSLPPTLRRAQQLLALDLNDSEACEQAHILQADASVCTGRFDHVECCARLHNGTGPEEYGLLSLESEIGEILALAV